MGLPPYPALRLASCYNTRRRSCHQRTTTIQTATSVPHTAIGFRFTPPLAFCFRLLLWRCLPFLFFFVAAHSTKKINYTALLRVFFYNTAYRVWALLFIPKRRPFHNPTTILVQNSTYLFLNILTIQFVECNGLGRTKGRSAPFVSYC